MDAQVLAIAVPGLVLAFAPVGIVIGILYHWGAGGATGVYATVRMLIQLLLVGYVLVYIFAAQRPAIIVAVVLFMLTVASWIAIRPVRHKTRAVYVRALAAISIGGIVTLALVSQFVIGVAPWYSPRYVVPLAGMVIAAAMNTVSLAAERFQAECDKQTDYVDARRIALQAALIPVTNSLFAVGLVSLPGMMTGQILSGVSPLLAAKYQIVIMATLFGASGMAAALYLLLAKRSIFAHY